MSSASELTQLAYAVRPPSLPSDDPPTRPLQQTILVRPHFVAKRVADVILENDSLEPPCTDPYAGWCGRGRRVTPPLCRSNRDIGHLLRYDVVLR
jgi:hypothetical protein